MKNRIGAFVASALTATAMIVPSVGVADDKLTIGVIELFGGEFFTEARKGINDVATREGVEVLIENGDGDVAKEAAIVQTFITRQVDAVMISSQSPTGSLAAHKLLKEASIPVVCYDTCLNPPEDKDYVQAFVTSDNKGLGTITGGEAAKYIKENLGGKATVVMLTCETFDVCKARRKGVNEALAGLEITFADEQEAFVLDKARPIADAMLTAHPETNVFIAFNDGAAIAAGQAVEEAGLLGKVQVFAIDVNPQVAKMIADPNGAIKWTTGQDPYAMGAKGLEATIQAARGEAIAEFYQFTPSPTFSKADPAAAQAYVDSH